MLHCSSPYFVHVTHSIVVDFNAGNNPSNETIVINFWDLYIEKSVVMRYPSFN